MRAIDRIIIHHDESDVVSHNDISVIKDWHLKRGFSDVGYHFYIQTDGSIQKGRKVSLAGAHCFGYNETSIGVCLHGDEMFHQLQFDSARILIQYLRKIIHRPLSVHGHNEFSKKKCPNFDVQKEIINKL